MSDSAITPDDLIALEEKLLFQEDSLQKLDDVVRKQYDLIDGLARRLKALEEKINMLEDVLEGAELNGPPADEKPPHY